MNRRSVLLGGVAACVAPPAFAHRSARTETEVWIKPSGEIDVTHVYHAQDAQDALHEAGLLERRDISSLRAQARLALYTAERFSLSVGDRPVSLEIIGAELVGDSVYVYQSGATPDASGDVIIGASMLRDLVRNQRNSVNVVRDGRTVTVDFIGDDGPKSVA